MNSPLTLIVAMTPDAVIAADGKIPWRVPEDLQRFKRLTTGHAIIMGRKTHDTIGRALPDRTNIILTRNLPPGGVRALRDCFFAPSFGDGLELARSRDDSPFVIGGGEIYAAALPYATRLEITLVGRRDHRAFDARSHLTRFPLSWDRLHWDFRLVAFEAAGDGVADVEYHTYERRA